MKYVLICINEGDFPLPGNSHENTEDFREKEVICHPFKALVTTNDLLLSRRKQKKYADVLSALLVDGGEEMDRLLNYVCVLSAGIQMM